MCQSTFYTVPHVIHSTLCYIKYIITLSTVSNFIHCILRQLEYPTSSTVSYDNQKDLTLSTFSYIIHTIILSQFVTLSKVSYFIHSSFCYRQYILLFTVSYVHSIVRYPHYLTFSTILCYSQNYYPQYRTLSTVSHMIRRIIRSQKIITVSTVSYVIHNILRYPQYRSCILPW